MEKAGGAWGYDITDFEPDLFILKSHTDLTKDDTSRPMVVKKKSRRHNFPGKENSTIDLSGEKFVSLHFL